MKRTFKALRQGGPSLLFRRAAWKLADQYPLFTPTVKLFGRPLAGDQKMLGKVIDDVVVNNQYHIELIKKAGVVIDAGAHVGTFSLFVAEMHPDATVYAFEPTPSTFKLLQENTKHRPNIRCFNHGLGDTNETSKIIETQNAAGNYISKDGTLTEVQTAAANSYVVVNETPIEIKTIDSLGIDADFIKMDVEGFEAKVLLGAAETIKRCRPVISMSAYHKPNDKTELPRTLNAIAPYTCTLYTDAEEDLVCTPIL